MFYYLIITRDGDGRGEIGRGEMRTKGGLGLSYSAVPWLPANYSYACAQQLGIFRLLNIYIIGSFARLCEAHLSCRSRFDFGRSFMLTAYLIISL